MNEQIKSCVEFEKALKKFQKEFRKQNLDNLKGVDLCYKWKWSSELLQSRIIDILNYDSISSNNDSGFVSFNKKSVINELKYAHRKYRSGAMLTCMESNYEDDDTVHIDTFVIYIIKDFIYEFIAKNPDKLDEFFDYCKLMLRHEFGHCLNFMTYIGMSYKDFLFYRKEVASKYDLQTLNEIQNMENSRKKMSRSSLLMIDGIPMHYLMFNEIAAIRRLVSHRKN